MLIILIEILAILIPLAGIVALLRNKQQSESSIRLLLTSFGCLVMNIGTLLMETAQNEARKRGLLLLLYYISDCVSPDQGPKNTDLLLGIL